MMFAFAILFLLTFCDFWNTVCGSQPFDAFDRKVFKVRKHRYASFDRDGILTLDGTVNGKSNDITFPNLEASELNQESCMKHPTLVFELCETDYLKAWTVLIICYESKLAQPHIDPFFRIRPQTDYIALVNDVCGQLQNAIIIKREVHNNTKNASPTNECAPYKPMYSFRTSFAPKKPIFFEMPDRRVDRQCVLLHFGGSHIFGFNLTNLRREPMPFYKDFDRNNYAEGELNNTFVDMANRQNRLKDRLGPWNLLLDFAPKYGENQNVSLFGWIPLKIKITSLGLKPCTLGWNFLLGREVSGLQAGEFITRYTLQTGLREEEDKRQSSNRQMTNDTSRGESNQIGGSISEQNMPNVVPGAGGAAAGAAGKAAGAAGSAAGAAGKAAGAAGKAAGAAGPQQPMSNTKRLGSLAKKAGVNFQYAWGSTEGYYNSKGEYKGITSDNWMHETKTRTETVFFRKFEGNLNIEQAVFKCFGSEFGIDRIRYRDISDNPQMPDAVEVEQAAQNAAAAEKNAIMEAASADALNQETCFDYVAECAVWAGKGECHNRKTFMLTKCKQSCGLCKTVRDNLKPKGGFVQVDKADDQNCADDEQFAVDCEMWAKNDGQCRKNPLFMNRHCRKSCRLCRGWMELYLEAKERSAHVDDY